MPVTSLTDEYMARLHMELGPLIPSVDEVSSHGYCMHVLDAYHYVCQMMHASHSNVPV
jgi:hypothetical protein